MTIQSTGGVRVELELLKEARTVTKRLVEVFTAGCPLCDETVRLVNEIACPSCDVRIYSLADKSQGEEASQKASQYGIYRIPAVVVNGKLAECCRDQQPMTRAALVAAGVGQG